MNNNKGYEHPGCYRRYNSTFELCEVVTEGLFREFKENLDRCVDKLNEDMVVKLELKQISSEKVSGLCFSQQQQGARTHITEEEFVAFPPPSLPLTFEHPCLCSFFCSFILIYIHLLGNKMLGIIIPNYFALSSFSE